MDINPKYDHYDFPTKSANATEGFAGHLTEPQIAQVNQLRMMLEAEGFTARLDTLTLLRFLRARKFDVNAAKKMFVDTEAWRKQTNLDEVIKNWDYPEKAEVSKYYSQYYHKTDKVGRPVYIEHLGGIDLNALYKITTAERMLTNLAVEYERMADDFLPACSRQSDQLIETACTIMDLKGISLTKVPSVYSYVQQASAISQNYYPERLGKLYLINAPWGFSTVWSAVKGWLDPVTVKKINILGSGYSTELLKQIPAENLPKEFGGSCVCAEGCQHSDAGPWHDPKWAGQKKPAAAAETIDNTSAGIETPGQAGPAPAAAAPATDAPAQPAPAAV